MMEFHGLHLRTAPSVYVPQEDSFLLSEAAHTYAKGKVLDLGCGSGVVGLSAAQKKLVNKIVFADINPAALTLAETNAKANHLKKPHVFVQTDLFTSFSSFKPKNGFKAAEKFDTLCFNPPYLPTSAEEKLMGHENAAYDGGKDGRKVLDRFLKIFKSHLAPGGVLLLLNSSVSANDGLSGNEQTQKCLENNGFKVNVVGQQAFFFEKLVVFKLE
ncbi:methyltransferase [Candidatus Micrarchaeota archaeon]|nr:methyltransferase [Candidatus Micrarchaeota archaeon]